MSIADTVRRLVEAGATPEVIAIAVEAIEQAGQKAVRSSGERTRGAERQARYRERLEASGLTTTEWRALSRRVIERDGACAYCGSQSRLCCDHVDPLIQGGGSDEANLVAACSTCNQAKSGRTVEEWKGAAWAAAWREKRYVTARERLVTLQDEGASLPLPPSPQTPQPPTPSREYNPPLPPRAGSRRKAKVSLPDGFPTAELIAEQQAKAREVGANFDVQRFAARFRDQCIAKDHRYADWPAAWRNWCRTEIDRAPKTALAASQSRATPSEADRWRRWLREYRLNGHWPSDDAGPRPGHPACRVPAALLAEFGLAPAPANDPNDLFDRGAAA
ncbi:HNH endonuclease [Brevundimonas sp. M1A4_2e]